MSPLQIYGPDGLPKIPAGATGAQGPEGPQGQPGPQGDVGSSGPQGDLGPRGVQGVEGPVGPVGPAGQSTRIIGPLINHTPDQLPADGFLPADWDAPGRPKNDLQCQANDAVIYLPPNEADPLYGVVFQFVPAQNGWMGIGKIVGPQGDPGPQGPVGATGPQGDPGPQGAAGPVGPAGPVGAQGVQGVTGLVGPPGPTGAVGATGLPGPVGPAGPGLAPGGAVGQFLVKAGAADYQTGWEARKRNWNLAGDNSGDSTNNSNTAWSTAKSPVFTAPADGWYRVHATLNGFVAANAVVMAVALLVDSTVVRMRYFTGTANYYELLALIGTFQLLAGQKVAIGYRPTAAGKVVTLVNSNTIVPVLLVDEIDAPQ